MANEVNAKSRNGRPRARFITGTDRREKGSYRGTADEWGTKRKHPLIAPIQPVFPAPEGRLLYLRVKQNVIKRYFAAHEKAMSEAEIKEKNESRYWIKLGIQQAQGFPIRRGFRKSGPFSEGLVIQRAFECAEGADALVQNFEAAERLRNEGQA